MMEKGFWSLVDEFLGRPGAVLRVPTPALRMHLASVGLATTDEYIEELLLEDSAKSEPSLRWSVSKGADGKLVFTPR